MRTEHIERAFNKIGVRFHAVEREATRFRRNEPDTSMTLDTIGNKRSAFVLVVGKDAEGEVQLLNVNSNEKAVLLQMKQEDTKVNFLCGLDEFDHTFIARVPNQGVTDVVTAKEALKPQEVLGAEESTKRMKKKHKNKRVNPAWVRQGEWFFIPSPSFNPDNKYSIIRKNAPLIRQGSRAHKAELAVDVAGASRYFSRYENVPSISEKEYQRKLKTDPAEQYKWELRSESVMVMVKGKITAPDHKTLNLRVWHRAVPNQELSRSGGIASTTFFD